MLLSGNCNSADLQNWQKDIKLYEKSKRTKKPFGNPIPPPHIITEKEKKIEQNIFNPLLQTYKNIQNEKQILSKESAKRTQSLLNQMKNIAKYQKSYDIVNLYPPKQPVENDEVKKISKAPLRYDFNIVSNQPLPQFYFKNTEIRLTDKPQKKNSKEDIRDYNILTNQYHENNDERIKKQIEQTKNIVQQKYKKTHEFNPLVGKFYDSKKQQQYLEELDKQMKQHGKDQILKLPPSYIYRQRFVVDPTKQIPQEVKQLQQKNLNAKKRYQLKYRVEKQYAERNIQNEQKQNNIIKNKIHEGKVLQDQKKIFDIISLNNYDMDYKLSLYGKKPMGSTWDKIVKTRNTQLSKEKNLHLTIKTSGFNH